MRRRLFGLLLASVLLGGLFSTGASAAPPAGTDRWALLVGVNDHQGSTRDNRGAVGDAQALRQLLVRSGWPSDHIRVLTDGAATAAGIREGLSWLAANSSDSSFSVFGYSGHVKQQGSTVYLWPHDNQWIADVEVAENLRRIRGFGWTHIAGCEAAAFDKGVSGPRMLVTASSQGHEKSYEYGADIARSVFGSLLVDQGMLARAADANGDTKVSIQEAFRYAADRAPGITAREPQGPQNPYLAGGDGSEWFLEGTAPAAPPPRERRCLLFLCFP
ncbi:MAG TPA: caspase family protein [Acidimicrobiales bacterium]|nr:caspase family protein [Acidimicrobiales bacterium]